MVLKGGSKTKDGFYWKKGEWEIVTVGGENGRLPGPENAEYLHVPAILLVPLALILGLGFYLFLPLIGFAMLLSLIVKKIGRKLLPPTLLTHGDERPGDLHAPHEVSRPAHLRAGGGVS